MLLWKFIYLNKSKLVYEDLNFGNILIHVLLAED